MPKWSLTNKGNVIQCKWDCKANHEHFVGSYERAVKYFGVEQNEIKSYGNLMNIIIYQQTSQHTVPKLSNELYDILINAMSEHKYWVSANERHSKAIEILKEAREKGYIMDELICKTIDKKAKDNVNQQRRKYMFEIWIDQNAY